MKQNTFPSSRGLGAFALLAACVIGLPLTSQAQRSSDSRREREPGQARPSAPAPSRPSVSRPSAPSRPPVTSRPSIPQRPAPVTRPSVTQRPAPVTRPSVPQRPPVVSRPTPQRPSPVTRPPSSVTRPSLPGRPSSPGGSQRPGVVTRPSVPGRPPGVVTRPSLPSRPPGVVTRPSVPSRPSLPGGVIQRPGSGSSRPDIHRPGSGSSRPSFPRKPGISTASSRHHWHFHDSSRFAHVDRHISYRSYPRNYYRLCHGNGWRGLGWYFGPPNVSYYYETPGVYYYTSRDYAPATYVNLSYSPVNSLDYAVQDALANLGYYDGPLDGDIGPMSRLAIANFQADNGLEPTGIVDEVLVDYLQIQ